MLRANPALVHAPVPALALALVRALVPALVAAVAGCHSASECAPLGDPAGIATSAARLRLEVYPEAARCSGDRVATAAIEPIKVIDSFSTTAPLTVDLGAGAFVVHLVAYSDSAGTTIVGEGCAETTISHNATSCLLLTIHPVAALRDGSPPPEDLLGRDLADSDLCSLYSHTTGVPPSRPWSDCTPPASPPTDASAELACQHEYPGLQCTAMNCPGGGNAGNAVCAKPGNGCVCWTWSGPGAGHVHVLLPSGSCSCATAVDPAWY